MMNKQSASSTLVVGVPENCYASLVYLAYELGYFQRSNLNIILKQYASGRHALRHMVNNHLDLAIAGEIPVVMQAFQRPELRILCSVGSSDREAWLLGRSDRGVTDIDNLRRKTVGIKYGSGYHHILSRYLDHYSLSDEEVILRCYETGAQLPQAIKSGEVDAISYPHSIKFPFGGDTAELFGAAAVPIRAGGIYRLWFNLVTTKRIIETSRQQIEGLLSTLSAAQAFLKSDTDRAATLVGNQLGVDMDRIKEVWSRLTLGVALDEGLLENIEHTRRWIAEHNIKGQWNPPSPQTLISPSFAGEINALN